MYLLASSLTGSRRAAAVAGVLFVPVPFRAQEADRKQPPGPLGIRSQPTQCAYIGLAKGLRPLGPPHTETAARRRLRPAVDASVAGPRTGGLMSVPVFRQRKRRSLSRSTGAETASATTGPLPRKPPPSSAPQTWGGRADACVQPGAAPPAGGMTDREVGHDEITRDGEEDNEGSDRAAEAGLPCDRTRHLIKVDTHEPHTGSGARRERPAKDLRSSAPAGVPPVTPAGPRRSPRNLPVQERDRRAALGSNVRAVAARAATCVSSERAAPAPPGATTRRDTTASSALSRAMGFGVPQSGAGTAMPWRRRHGHRAPAGRRGSPRTGHDPARATAGQRSAQRN